MDRNEVNWPVEFSEIISCDRCVKLIFRNILRDGIKNVPQSGFIGKRYHEKKILLVRQNPGVSNCNLAVKDRVYTAALRRVHDDMSDESFTHLLEVLENFIPSWPVHGNYLPLQEPGLALDQIAYFNLVRCRTEKNSPPSMPMASECANKHFTRWLDSLIASAMVFMGKWACDRGNDRGIPNNFMNRHRSRLTSERVENRLEMVSLIQSNT